MDTNLKFYNNLLPCNLLFYRFLGKNVFGKQWENETMLIHSIFSKCLLFFQDKSHPLTHTSDTICKINTCTFNLEKFETLLFGKELTHYQTTNFRLFKTERVCRRQFQM